MEQRVRLVRACGSKRYKVVYRYVLCKVRLVRACGSKPARNRRIKKEWNGQARKSLWIETWRMRE